MAYVTDDSALDLYRRRVGRFDALDAATEIALARAWAQGDERAGCRLIEANLRVVIAIAREYRRWGVSLEDLIQEGNIGLYKAARRYDPSRGNQLRSYAGYWIRAEIREFVVRTYRIVRLGATRTERRAIRAFRSSRVATAEDLAAQSGMPLARCQMLWPLLLAGDRSLDASFDGQPPLIDSIGHGGESPEAAASAAQDQRQRERAVRDALSTLPERERKVLKRRYMMSEQSTLEELGRELGVSRERVRQLEERAKGRMRSALETSLSESAISC